jgi:hypothetical protein
MHAAETTKAMMRTSFCSLKLIYHLYYKIGRLFIYFGNCFSSQDIEKFKIIEYKADINLACAPGNKN